MKTREGELLNGPVIAVHVEVAEFVERNGEFVEGPRLLARSLTVEPGSNTLTEVTYYADGVIHSEAVTSEKEGTTQTEITRYQRDGTLRDKWLVVGGYRSSEPREVFQYDAKGHSVQTWRDWKNDENMSAQEDGDTRVEREFDQYGNWIRETRFFVDERSPALQPIPSMVTYRLFTYQN